MFTGLIEAMGVLEARERRGRGARLCVTTKLGPLALGESIATDGVCLTVETLTGKGFAVDASFETLERTTLGGLPVGAPVRLERAVAVGQRLGGHIVSGHVDGVGTVVSTSAVGEALRMTIRVPRQLARYIAEKGSVAVNGVSLTVNRERDDTFEVALVPHTLRRTMLGELAAGAPVNLEVDVLARYCERLLRAPDEEGPGGDDAWMTRLRAGGFA